VLVLFWRDRLKVFTTREMDRVITYLVASTFVKRLDHEVQFLDRRRHIGWGRGELEESARRRL
jgi:hypothetical protein